MRAIRHRRVLDIWPGFVDALASLLMAMTFVLVIFTIGQFFLSDALMGRDRALEALNAQIAGLAEELNMAKAETRAVESEVRELDASLAGAQQTLAARDAENARLRRDVELLEQLKKELEADVARLAGQLDSRQQDLAAQTEMNAKTVAQVELLNRQIAALRDQLREINGALELARTDLAARDARIEDLGRRLNLALADRVRQLAQYRSEFFGRLRSALKDRKDVKVVGDRFIFPSEVLFDSGSDELGAQGVRQLDRLAATIKEIAVRIPPDLDWVLQIDGHTDRRPIHNARFPSNWELSTARAVAIVKFLRERAVPAERLAAAGYGEFQPLDPAENAAAYARNRRIELRLTNR
jgi:chemotaxis protein MotB